MKTKNQILNNQRGQSLIEYVILVALVAVGTMGMVRLLQKSVSVNLGKIIYTLQDSHDAIPRHERVTQRDLRKADFSDFMSGANGQARDHEEK